MESHRSLPNVLSWYVFKISLMSSLLEHGHAQVKPIGKIRPTWHNLVRRFTQSSVPGTTRSLSDTNSSTASLFLKASDAGVLDVDVLVATDYAKAPRTKKQSRNDVLLQSVLSVSSSMISHGLDRGTSF